MQLGGTIINATYRNPYIGHPSQLLRINDYVAVDGKAHGIRATDIHNGRLSLTVCADKGMDFPYLSYKGINMGYIAPCGLAGSSYYDDRDAGFLRVFFAGFLTTCGLTHTGTPCDIDGRHYGLHGRINNTPAEEYSAKLVEDDIGSRAVVSGLLRQGSLLGENLTLRREIIVGCDEKSFSFEDHIVNRSFQRERHMMLYHFNMGYPLLDESAELFVPYREVQARDAHSQAEIDRKLEIPAPISGTVDQCYFYRLCTDINGQTFAGIYNHNLDFGMLMEFDGNLLDHFVQWKMVCEGQYILGLEPGNATSQGVLKESELGHVKYLEPWESRTYRFNIRIFEGNNELSQIRERTKRLQKI